MFDYVLQKAEKFFEFFVLGTIPNQTCKNHLIEIWKHYRKKSIWAQQNSMTKVPVGLLTAHGIVAGNMEECLEVTVNEDFGNFTGKHCLTGKYGPGSSKVAQYRWGICMPSTCSANDLLHLLKYGLHLPAHFDELDCRTLNDERPFQPREIFALCVIALLLLLVTLSTIYDRITSSGNKNGFFIAFSLIRNFKTMIETKSPPGTFPVIHGFRFYATVMVILSHTYMMCAAGMRPINLFKYETWLSDWDHVWLTSRGFMLNTFFVLSGFFISFLFLKDRDKGINFNIYLYWIHRILRIGPVLYMMLLFTSTLTNRLSSAPRWLAYSRNLEESCKQNWWEYVLFINTWWGNLECMEHAWYVSVDIQLQERNLYELPFHRITPWVSGIIFGYFVYKKKKETPNSENGHREKTAREKCVKVHV
ncbi:hypothetical protein C0J52_00554 [Blattella germanica]|nr:hypothetical protein C0J52_00554 [Blattella germanica]